MRPPLQPSQVQLGIVGGAVVRPVPPNVMTPPEQHVRRGCSKRGLELQAGPVHVRIATETDRVAMRARAPYYIIIFCVKYSVINDQKHKILIFKKKVFTPTGERNSMLIPSQLRRMFVQHSRGPVRVVIEPPPRCSHPVKLCEICFAETYRTHKNKKTKTHKNKKTKKKQRII